MASLAFFTETSIPSQSEAYGVKSNKEFLVSSKFTITTETKAYAMMKGTILLQQQASDVDKANLILRAHNQKELRLPVKYIIYRGLKITDFITDNDLTNPANKVKTSGSELLSAMQVIQQGRAPGDDIPLEALFGNELSPANNKNIDEFFFKNLAPNSQLFTIECGAELGNFAVGDIGIEIILENPEFFVDVELAKEEKFEIKIGSSMSSAEKKWRKDLVRHFVDPAAFYGLHYDIEKSVEYRDSSNNKQSANTKDLVYNQILEPFKNTTRNIVYLDIRNENGYSYNYYDNYVGDSEPDADKELKIGQTSGSVAAKEYYTLGWAIHTVDITPGSGEDNEFFIALRVNDNERPLLASWNVELTPNSVIDPPIETSSIRRVYFTDEILLLPTPIPSSLPDFTNTISIKVPNIPSESAQLSTIVRLDYIKQLLPITTANKFPRINFTDYIFGPLNVDMPWDKDGVIEWVTTNHRTYIDVTSDGYVLGQYKTTILSIDLETNEIVIFDEVPVELSKQVILEYGDDSPQTKYTPNKITFDNGKTKIEVNETIITALQTGDQLTLTVRLDGVLDYDNNKFIIRDSNCVNLEVLSVGNRLHFYSIEFLNTYEISSTIFNAPNTEIAFTNSKPKAGIAGFVETGILLEDDPTGTGGSDNDRILFYATPTNAYIKKANRKKSKFQKKGGTLNVSFADALKRILPDIEFEKTVLNLAPDSINVFSLTAKKKAKDILFLLGLTREEWDIAKASITTTLHQRFFKLLSTTSSKTDEEDNRYYEYELQVAGEDTEGDFLVVNTGIKVYSKDRLVYVTAEFGKRADIDTTLAEQVLNDFINETLYGNGKDFGLYRNPDLNFNSNSNLDFFYSVEETTNLSNSDHSNTKGFWLNNFTDNDNGSVVIKANKTLFDLDSSMKVKIEEFKNALDDNNVKSKSKIKKILREKGADLLKHAKERITEKDLDGEDLPYTNKDGILYLTRLIMSVIIRNHPKIIDKYKSKIQEFLEEFEKHSRGLKGTEKPDFSQQPSYKKILISGFDPFNKVLPGAFAADNEGHITNTSGIIALAFDGRVIDHPTDVSKKAYIQSVIFPVRFQEFDEGWVEKFFKKYIDVDVIVTFSHGVYETPPPFPNFNYERFAVRYRRGGKDNNSIQNINAMSSIYLNKPDKDNKEFLLNTLPSQIVNISDKVKFDQTLEYKYSFIDQNNTIILPKDDAIEKFGRSYSTTNPKDLPDITDTEYEPSQYGVTIPGSATKLKLVSRSGSGGAYLSNEIFYRVAFLRENSNSEVKTGHIHVGFTAGDRIYGGSDDREKMLEIVERIIQNIISNIQW